MKITIYELLGMVKDGKAPKKIKYEDVIYELTSNEDDYYNKSYGYWFTNQICSLGALNNEVKILDNLEDKARFQYSEIPTWLEKKEIIKAINENFEKHQKAIYELIDCLKSKGE